MIRASSGTYDDANKTAILEGEVTLESGSLRMELMDAEWINEERRIRSDKPVTIVDGESHWEASSVIYLPDERLLIARNAKGRYKLKRTGKP